MVFLTVFGIGIICIALYFYHHQEDEPQEVHSQQPPTVQPITVTVNSDRGQVVPIQELKYFCVKDKGYHVSVWPKNQRIGDYEEFTIAGLSHRDNIDDYLGEFKGTLEAEPTNEYDPNAIKVLAPDGHHVGYVPSDQTRFIREFTELPCTCYCYIGCNNGTYFSDCFINRNN